jgi:DNA-binding NarL/FixJ family response regulator
VLIADDDRLFAEGLKALLATDGRLDVVGRAANGEEAVGLARSLDPDLVLMDLHMPLIDGIEATGRITQSSDATVVVLTSSDDVADVDRAFRAGAAAFLRKEIGGPDLAGRLLALAAASAERRSD